MPISQYHDPAVIGRAVREGRHRDIIGGLWEQLGQLQFDFLVRQGLKPQHRLVDIGCGSLRAGVKLVDYLNTGNYFGTDLNADLLDAGYERELTVEQRHKLPRTNLIADGDFDFSWAPRPFDVAVAQSVFTHLPIGSLRTCLERLAPAMVAGGVLYATIFEVPDDWPSGPFRHSPGEIVSHEAQNPYHHRRRDVVVQSAGLRWLPRYIGDWGHPRAQKMIAFELR